MEELNVRLTSSALCLLTGFVLAASLYAQPAASNDPRPLLKGSTEPQVQTDGLGSISFLLEENTIFPEQWLIDLDDLGISAGTLVTFDISQGRAAFIDGSRVKTLPASEKISLPAIVAASAPDESFVNVSVEGRQIVPKLRFASLRSGMLTELKEVLLVSGDLGEGATLVISDHYVIIDESRIDLQKIKDLGGEEGEVQQFYEPDFPCDNSDCNRSPAGPGRVEWQIPDPWSLGFSVKPEVGGNVLLIASPPWQAIDGVYNRAWGTAGCGQALKVPDSCTAYIQAAFTLYCCCNRLLRLLGYECVWIDTHTLSDWRDCAL